MCIYIWYDSFVYSTDYQNNNYLTPSGGYDMQSYNQLPPLSDGPLGGQGANKVNNKRFVKKHYL